VNVNLTEVTAISAGNAHTCALLRNGSVACWGRQGFSGTNYGSLPKLAPLATNIVALASGAQHTCALSSNGNLFCWGENSSGSVGNGTSAPVLFPAQVVNLEEVVDMALGHHHS